jgi:Cys-tRNA(Pro)/Cys-tRNA(Cys) deacylase
MAGRGTPATLLLARSGASHQLHEYRHDPHAESYGQEAATALGVEADRVFKTLVATVDGRPWVAVVPVTGQVSLKLLAGVARGKKADMAAPELAERMTGYVVGGISPLGQRKTLPTVIDETAELFDTIFVSGGRRGLEIEIAAADLATLTGATVAAIAAA